MFLCVCFKVFDIDSHINCEQELLYVFSSDVTALLFHFRLLYFNCLAAVAITLFFVLKDEKL